jgi:hypothetical protein
MMNNNQAQTVKEWGLLANGSSGRWFIDVDESDAGDEWNMQIDGPTIYVRFPLPDLQVVPNLLAYLRAGLNAGHANDPRSSTEFPLTKLGSLSASITQDDEFTTRWFIIINGKSDAVVRLTLDAADVEMLVEALRQVIEDLPD